MNNLEQAGVLSGRHVDRHAALFRLADCIGPLYGTEDFSLFLYSLVRMQAPRTIVELGTGVGVSTFAMALAASANGVGHVWSVDDLSHFAQDPTLFGMILAKIQQRMPWILNARSPEAYFYEVASYFGVEEIISFVREKVSLDETRHFDRYPFGQESIDLLFSDFRHSPKDVLALLGHFLPRMSPASSIFIDSASTLWSSYLMLEQLVMQLNLGKIPAALQDLCNTDLRAVVQGRRFVLVHLTEQRDRDQNSTTWIKLEPLDLQPHPKTRMRGMF